MSLNLVPGYDFTFNELVTSEKLRKWIGGAHNTASLTAAEVGVSSSNTGDNLHTTATWATTATVGALTFNTSTGWVELTTPRGSVPIFGTQGGLFTKRLREGESSEAAFGRFYEGDVPNMLGVKPGHTPTLPAASYSLGEGYDDFGMNTVHVAACIQGASDMSGVRASKTFARYPSEHSFNPSGAWTVATYVTGTTYVHSLYKLGGAQTLRIRLLASSAGTTNYTITATLDPSEGSYGLAEDWDNNLIFSAGSNDYLSVWFIPNNHSSISVVDSNNTDNEGKAVQALHFDTARRFLYCALENGTSSRGFSIFEVDTAGNLTHLFHDGSMNGAYGIAFYQGSDYVHCGGGGLGLHTFKINSGTNASLVNVDDPGRVGRCVAINGDNGIVGVEDTNGDDSRYAWYHSNGSVSLVGTDHSGRTYNDTGIAANDNYIFHSNADNDVVEVFSHNTNCSIEKLTEIPDTLFTQHPQRIDVRGDYLVTGDSQNGGRLFNISDFSAAAVSNITLIKTYNTGINTSKGVVFLDASKFLLGESNNTEIDICEFTVIAGTSSAVSGLRGGTLSGVWELEQSTATNTPQRIVPFSQCFNYYGAKQLSVGMVNPILSKDDFRTGGYEF